MNCYTPSLDLSALADCDLIIEAVFEDMDIKSPSLVTDKIASPALILATNTSALNIDEIASVTARPEDVIGLHFFSPANVMRLLEIVRAEKTAAMSLHLVDLVVISVKWRPWLGMSRVRRQSNLICAPVPGERVDLRGHHALGY